MILAFARYVPRAVIAFVADIAAFVLAPVAALFVSKDGTVHPLFRWITTHDAPIDAGHLDGYWPMPKGPLGLWWSRVRWIWRNPAYRVSQWMGFDQRGVSPSADGFRDARWDTGEPNKAFWRVKNHKGQGAFLLQGQRYYYKNWCVEYQFGWKLYRRDADQWCMLAFRLSPFKRYP